MIRSLSVNVIDLCHKGSRKDFETGKHASCVNLKLMVAISSPVRHFFHVLTHLLTFHVVCSVLQPTNASQNFQLEMQTS